MKKLLLDIIHRAIAAVDPEKAIKRSVVLNGDSLVVCGENVELGAFRNIHVLGAGKASAAMARGLEMVLGQRLAGGMIATTAGHNIKLEWVEIIEASHPLPDRKSEIAARNALDLARALSENDLLLCLLSGGASALWSLPDGALSLDDKVRTTSLLLGSGADIHEMNTVRKHLSQIKGGRLAAAAYPARIITLAISDVVGDELTAIGSGPTVADPTTFGQALGIVKKYGLESKLPENVLGHLRNGEKGDIPETPKSNDPVFAGNLACVIASNNIALAAAEEAGRVMGFNTYIVSNRVTGEAREVGREYAALARKIRADNGPVAAPAMLLAGGETTVTLRGKGRGGRNQELVLAAAMALEGLENAAIVSAGTDGIDGVTEAAGAYADGKSLDRGRRMGIEAAEYLDSNNSYMYFKALDDLIITGPMGTNVMDIHIILVE